MSLRYLSIGPVNFGFGAAESSDVVGSEHEQQVCGLRVPVARLRSSSTSMRSGALRSRDGLGSASSISESAAACGLGRSEVDGSPGERRALPAATAAAARHFPRLERQLAHFGPASEQIPSFGGLPLRFIGAQRLRSSRSPAHGPASHARDNRNFQRRAGKRRSHIPKIGRQAPVTLSYSDD